MIAKFLLAFAAGVAASAAVVAPRLAPPAEPTTHGEWVTVPGASGSGTLRAYVAYPETKAPAPAVVVIHEIFGLTEWEPTVADRLAKLGYVAIAPDLLSPRWGQSPAADSARKLIAQLVPADIDRDLGAAIAYLEQQPGVQRGAIGTIGFCWGGRQSFRYATVNPRLKGVVVCYGDAPDSTAMANIQAKVLGVYGENDARINAALPQVEARMQALGKSYKYRIYGGTGHGFLKPGRQGYGTPAVDEAWAAIDAFYKGSLTAK